MVTLSLWRARQVKYVVELARALAQHPAVFRVDLLTRLIQDPAVDPTYGEPEEVLWKAPDDHGMGGAYIVRLPCGPPKTYLRCSLCIFASGSSLRLWPEIKAYLGSLSPRGPAGRTCSAHDVHFRRKLCLAFVSVKLLC